LAELIHSCRSAPESLAGENTNGWFHPSVNSVESDRGVQSAVSAGPKSDSSAVSRNPVVTVGATDVEEDVPASPGAPASVVPAGAAAAGDTPAGSDAGFGFGAGGITAEAGSPLWARTVTAGGGA
jgi:hypothetical protein